MADPTARLTRVLCRRDLIIYGLVILTPTAPYPVFGVIQQQSQGHAALSYLVAMIAMLFTAISYGRMAGAFPSAGSTYAYARNTFGSRIGFLAGWSMILDYFLIPLLSVIYASITLARLWPAVPYAVWVALFTAFITIINLRGIRMTARANVVLFAIMLTCSLWFLVAAATELISSGAFALGWLSEAWIHKANFSFPSLLFGAGLATLSYIGFDAISTLSEESLDAKRDIPMATVLVCFLQGAICIATVYVASGVWPDFSTFPQVETAILDVGRKAGGASLFHAITIALLVAGIASSLTGQAGAARLLYAMGRDGVLPRRIFGQVNANASVPAGGLYVMSGLSLVGAFLIDFQLSVELVNFGAFVGFILVNLSIIRHFYFRRGLRHGKDLWMNLVFPLLGALICTLVWLSLSTKAKTAGFAWLGMGVFYLFCLTRGFRRPTPSLEVP